ncbi:MAG TPA: helix-turn-helix domain-containing protein [Solirubrobacter sp.]
MDDSGNELSQFLSSRRAKVTPEQAGLRTFGRRQVQGLRREEVAAIAGVSVGYYKRLERGNAAGVSDGVLDALADALLLDDTERAHLFDLARAAGPVTAKRRPRASAQQIRPAMQRIVDSIPSPASVGNLRGDSVYANALGRALYAPMFESREQPPNAARFTFLDPAAQQFFPDWEKNAKELVAALRAEAGRNPYDRALSDLIGELSTRSEPFRKWWAAHNVRTHDTGRKRLHHPTVGDLELDYEVMQLTADNGLLLAVFSAEPGTRSAHALDLLASWTATPDPAPASGEAPRWAAS